MNTITGPDLKHPVNYIFVDCENVKSVDLSVVGARTVHLTLLLGAQQTRLDAALVEKLMEHSASAQLVRLQSSGRNALDFALAFYLGKAANTDPTAYFHVVSKDTGFDPLIEHLRSRHIRARRHDDFTSLTFSVLPKTLSQRPGRSNDPCPRSSPEEYEQSAEEKKDLGQSLKAAPRKISYRGRG